MDPVEFTILLLMELVGALVGAFFGVNWGYKRAAGHERRMRQEEDDQERTRIVDSLIGEIKVNAKYLESEYKTQEIGGGRSMRAFWSVLLFSSYDAVIHSGNFRLISTVTQIVVNMYYLQIKRMNSLVLRLESEINNQISNPQTLNEMSRNHKMLIDATPEVIASLESEKEI